MPKGSFYHYFDSKEAFGLELIDRYAEFFARKLDRHFSQPERSPLARVRAFVDDARDGMARHAYSRGCLIGNLDRKWARCRKASAHVCVRRSNWQHRLAECLRAAQQAGELADSADPAELAAFFWIGWEGAVLRAKLERSDGPLVLFAQFFFNGLPRR